MASICEPRDTSDRYNAQFFIDDARKNNPARTPERYRMWLVNVVLCAFTNRMRHEYSIGPQSFPKFHHDHLESGWNSETLEQWNYIGKEEDAPHIEYIKFHIAKYDGTNGKRRGVALSMHKENDSDVLLKMRFLCNNFSKFLKLYEEQKILDYDAVNFENAQIDGITLD